MKTLPMSLSVALLMVSLFIPSSSGVSIENFETHIIGESPLTDTQGRYRMVAGIWHQTDVYLDSSANSVDIEMRFGDFSEKDTTNYYHWRYSYGNWSDVEYGIYIDQGRCDRTGTLYSFFIGVDGKVNYGLWNLTIKADGKEIYASEIAVEKPKVGAEFHSADFMLWIAPFTSGIIDSKDKGQYLRIVDGGNTPLYYNITFSSFSDRINITGKKDVIHVKGETTQYIRFTADSWSPRIIKIKGTVIAGGLYRIPTGSTASLISEVGSTFPITVYVGHSGYELTEENGFTIQRKRQISLDYNAEAELKIFLTGNGTANIDIRGDNCTIKELIYRGEKKSSPFYFTLSQDHEENISIRFRADVPNVTARVVYDIQYKGNESAYFTDVKVGPAPSPEPVPPPQPDRTIAAAFITITAGLATAYILLTQKKAAEGAKKKSGRDEKKNKTGKNPGKKWKKGGRKR